MELEKQIRLAGRVDSVIQKGMQEEKITGACVGIYQNQEEYLRKAYGLADREQETPMRTDTLFRIFSMTKPVTAVATMQLWESGKLELSDPVSWYIPAFREKLVDVHGELVPAKREICIQDLLNMTSGIPYPDCWSESQKKMGAFYGEIDRRNATDHPVDTQEFARRVGEEVPLLFQPGEKWSYGASADILGAVLEKAAEHAIGRAVPEADLPAAGHDRYRFLRAGGKAFPSGTAVSVSLGRRFLRAGDRAGFPSGHDGLPEEAGVFLRRGRADLYHAGLCPVCQSAGGKRSASGKRRASDRRKHMAVSHHAAAERCPENGNRLGSS